MKPYGAIRFVDCFDEVPAKGVFILRVESDSARLMKYYRGVSSNSCELVKEFGKDALDKANWDNTLTICRAEIQGDPQFSKKTLYVERPIWKTEEDLRKI